VRRKQSAPKRVSHFATMKFSLPAGSVRAYSTRIPRPRLPQKPPVRTNDPLNNNPNATVQELPDNMTFIHRPPPTADTPFSLTTAPASAFLRPPTASSAEAPLPPLTRADRPPAEPRVSQEVIQQIRHLRATQPHRFTRTALSKLYGVTPGFVGMVAPSKQSYRKEANRVMAEEHQAIRETWGERKAISVEIRRKRKEFW
jgi:hypothetical protein